MMIPNQHLKTNPLGWDLDASTASRPQWQEWFSGFFHLSAALLHSNGNPYTHLGIVDLIAGLRRLPVMPGGNGAAGKV